MRYKRLVCFFAVMMVLFVALNYVTWKNYTEDLLTDNNYDGGDLARLGYCYGSKDFRKNHDELPRRHIHIKNYAGEKVDMITLGDSFSNGGAGGKNRFYQDYIASINNITVLNLERYEDLDLITTISILLNNGALDRFKPRYMLISMAERGCFDLAIPVDFDKRMSQTEMAKLKKIQYVKRPNIAFINDGNLKYFVYNMFYPFSDHALIGGVYRSRLDRPMFTVANPKTLLHFKYKKFATPDDIRTLNNNFDTLAEKLAAKGITLFFMPVVEKYTLYSDYLVDNPYPKSTFFEDLRKLPKKYMMIDTKAILAEELKKGVKDIFYADDTHWSWKASEKVFMTVKFEN